MGIQEAVVSSRRIKMRLGICCFVMLLVISGNVISQETKTVKKINGSVLEIGAYVEIPQAAWPCTAAECEWWKQLREAGNNLQRKADDKSKKKYIRLIVEGLEKSYQVPLPDRPSQKLAGVPWPSPSKFWSSMTNGTVELSLEIKADGSVGDVIAVQQLNRELDQLCIRDAQGSIFLPAVKDRVFVTDWHKTGRTFFLDPRAAARGLKPN